MTKLAFAAAVCLLPAMAEQTTPKPEYRARRVELQKSITDGAVVLFGRTEREARDWRTGFRQEPNFYYLTGWDEPGAILLLSPAEEILFLPPRDERAERYTGRKLAAEDANARDATGFSEVLSTGAFETRLLKALERYPKIYTLSQEPQAAKLKGMLPFREVLDAQQAIGKLRMKKSAQEIALIERSVQITGEAHRAAWKRIAPGMPEYQASAVLTAVMMDKGCERHAYAPIVGSGPNGVVLHYAKNSRRMEKGEMVLIDAGAECSSYAADVTRTVPVSGKFTSRQRELYEVVLGAEQAAIAAVKPGIIPGESKDSPNSLYKIAYDYINSHGKDLQGKPLGKYLTHGVSHHVGLQVHDPGLPSQPLEAGNVVTVEPGLYIPEEGIGIRIEDTVLVTTGGARVLSSDLPKTPGEIERAMAHR